MEAVNVRNEALFTVKTSSPRAPQTLTSIQLSNANLKNHRNLLVPHDNPFRFNKVRSLVMSPTVCWTISSEYTSIIFPSRRNSFITDLNCVSTATAASDVGNFHERQLTSALFSQETEVSAYPFGTSVIQPAAASIFVWSCGKLQ